jgi:hypothetical protein
MADRLAKTNELLISSMENAVAKKIEFSTDAKKVSVDDIQEIQDV